MDIKKKVHEMDEQLNKLSVQILKDLKDSYKNIGEVRRVLAIELKNAKWENNIVYIETISRSLDYLEKEIDTISC